METPRADVIRSVLLLHFLDRMMETLAAVTKTVPRITDWTVSLKREPESFNRSLTLPIRTG